MLLILSLSCTPAAVQPSAQTSQASQPPTVVAAPDAAQDVVPPDEPLPDDPGRTHLFMASTGRALRQGEGYVGAYGVALPFVQVGLTDRVSIGAGTPVYTGGARHPFWVTPKLQLFNGARTQAAVGVLQLLNVGDASVGIAYGVVTHGSTDSAISAGVGYAYYRADDDRGGIGIVMIGGEHRLSRRVKFVTENHVFRGGGIAMGGVRWHREHLFAEFGVSAPFGRNFVYVFPVVNVGWGFSHKGASIGSPQRH
jgi:hypothetical protein